MGLCSDPSLTYSLARCFYVYFLPHHCIDTCTHDAALSLWHSRSVRKFMWYMYMLCPLQASSRRRRGDMRRHYSRRPSNGSNNVPGVNPSSANIVIPTVVEGLKSESRAQHPSAARLCSRQACEKIYTERAEIFMYACTSGGQSVGVGLVLGGGGGCDMGVGVMAWQARGPGQCIGIGAGTRATHSRRHPVHQGKVPSRFPRPSRLLPSPDAYGCVVEEPDTSLLLGVCE
jgi:hypothetical protein